MQPKVTGQFLAGQNPANAVALRVKLRRIHTDTQLPVNDTENSPGDPALCGQADLIRLAAGVIIQSARKHDRQNVFDVLEIKNLIPRRRVRSHVGESCRHYRHILAGNQQGTLREILVQCLVHLFIFDIEVAH